MRRLGLRHTRVFLRAGAAALVALMAATTPGTFDVSGIRPEVAAVPAAAAGTDIGTVTDTGARPNAEQHPHAAVLTRRAEEVASPGEHSGVPEGAEVLFHEDFQHRVAGSLELLTEYTGASGQRYEADRYWSDIARCNGFVLDVDTPYERGACRSSTNVFNDLLLLVQTLGEYASPDDEAVAEENAALAAMTQRDTTPQRLMLRTAEPVSLGEAGRFVTMSVDAAAMNCDQKQPLLQFSMISGGVTTPLSPNLMNTCLLPNERTFIVNKNVKPVRYGTLVSDGAILLADTSFHIQLENHETSGAGNDGAIDNMRVLDVTPHLEKSFAPASVPVGERSTLSYTITNTSELNAKQGWSFADTLPDGLTIAASPNVPQASCGAAHVTASPGDTTVTVTGGILNAGQASCAITIEVTSDTPRGAEPSPKQYVSDVASITKPVGVQPIGDAIVEFYSTPELTVQKVADATSVTQTGDTVRYRVTATNTGTGDFRDTGEAHLIDDLSGVLDDAVLDESTIAVAGLGMRASFDAEQQRILVTGPLSVGQSFTLRYDVNVVAALGDHVLQNVAFQAGLEQPNGDAPECEPRTTALAGIACTSHPLPYLTVTKRADAHARPAPGDIVTYTVTARNAGKAPFVKVAPARFTDDLTHVLDDATYQHDAAASRNQVALDYTAPRLSWRGPLKAGQSVTLTYSVKLGGAGDARVKNIAFVGAGETPTCDATAPRLGTCAALEYHMVHPGLSWQKVSAAQQRVLLGGSEWQLTPLDAAGTDQADQSITITDCAALDSLSCLDIGDPGDRDPAKGKLLLRALAPGEYRLYETKAPVGYQLLADPIRLTIPRSNDPVDLGAVTNTQRVVPAVPLTGGLGEYAFWIATAVAAVIAAVGAGVRLRQHRP